MKFDAAIRQNRRGKFRVATDLLPLLGSKLLLLQDRVMVVEKNADQITNGVEVWEGYSADFEPLALGAAAPFYEVLCHCAPAGIITITARRCAA
jgi:hypothetical protein